MLDPVVRQGGFDCVFGQHGAVQLDRGQRQLLGDVGVLELEGLVDRLSLDPLGGQGAAGDGRAATERLEFGVDDLAVLVHLDLELHHVAAGRGPHESRAHGDVVLVEGADIAGVLVVVDHVGVVGGGDSPQGGHHTEQFGRRVQRHVFNRLKTLGNLRFAMSSDHNLRMTSGFGVWRLRLVRRGRAANSNN